MLAGAVPADDDVARLGRASPSRASARGRGRAWSGGSPRTSSCRRRSWGSSAGPARSPAPRRWGRRVGRSVAVACSGDRRGGGARRGAGRRGAWSWSIVDVVVVVCSSTSSPAAASWSSCCWWSWSVRGGRRDRGGARPGRCRRRRCRRTTPAATSQTRAPATARRALSAEPRFRVTRTSATIMSGDQRPRPVDCLTCGALAVGDAGRDADPAVAGAGEARSRPEPGLGQASTRSAWCGRYWGKAPIQRVIDTSVGCERRRRGGRPARRATASITASSSRSATGRPSRPSDTRRICDRPRAPVRPLLRSERHGGDEPLTRLRRRDSRCARCRHRPAGDRRRAAQAHHDHVGVLELGEPPAGVRGDGASSARGASRPAPPARRRRSARRRPAIRRRRARSTVAAPTGVDASAATDDVAVGGVDERAHPGTGGVEDRSAALADARLPARAARRRAAGCGGAPRAATSCGTAARLAVVGVGGVDAADEGVDQSIVDLGHRSGRGSTHRSSRRDRCAAATARRRRAACPSSSAARW